MRIQGKQLRVVNVQIKCFVSISIIWIIIHLAFCQNVTLKDDYMQSVVAEKTNATESETVVTEYDINMYSIDDDNFGNNTQFVEQLNSSDDLGIDNSSVVPKTTIFVDENATKSTEPPDADKSIVTTTKMSDIQFDGICPCDLFAGACDVNCCCDKDCTASDRKSFSGCIPRPSPPSEQYCFKRNIIYINNTEYSTVRTENGLFCIVHDNFKERFFYQEKPLITSLKEFKNVRVEDHFTWTMDEKNTVTSPDVKAGKPIYVLSDKNSQQIRQWWLPFHAFSNLCESKKEVAYMIDMESSCQQNWIKFEDDCHQKMAINAKAYYKDLYLLKLPLPETNLAEINSTLENPFGNYSDSNFIPIQDGFCERSNSCVAVIPVSNYICRDEYGIPKICILNGGVPSPEFNESSRICKNVVTQVKYDVIHNGIHGIHKAAVKFETTDVMESSLPLTQTFSVRFHWLSDANNTFRRSGNPGYHIGEPVMAGSLKEKIPFQGIILGSNRNKWFTITGSSVDGSCLAGDEDRVTVKFGENTKSGCLLKILAGQQGNICAYIQEQIMNIFLGSNMPTYVGVFGNSDIHNFGDWVEILYEGKPVKPYPQATSDNICPSVVLQLNIEIAYASIGSLANPQRKIIGVMFKYATPQEIKLYCSGINCHKRNDSNLLIEITSSVSFTDVSEPAVAIYAKPPVIEAKLPDDVFYPFLSSAASTLLKHKIFIIGVVLFCDLYVTIFFKEY